MNPYADHIFWMLVSMLILGLAMLLKVGQWYRHWRSPTAQVMSKEQARSEFGGLMAERLGVAMRAAELDKVIIDRWEEWPLEYRPALYQVIRHTQLLEETMLDEAMQKGIYPARIVTQGPAIPPPPPNPRLPEPPEEEPKELRTAPRTEGQRVISLPGSTWVNDQLVKTG